MIKQFTHKDNILFNAVQMPTQEAWDAHMGGGDLIPMAELIEIFNFIGQSCDQLLGGIRFLDQFGLWQMATPTDWIIQTPLGYTLRMPDAMFQTLYRQADTDGILRSDIACVEMYGKLNVRKFGFGLAIAYLKDGKRVAREGWNGKGMFIALIDEKLHPATPKTIAWLGNNKPLVNPPHMVMYTADGKWQQGWLASQADMLASDWQLVTW